MSLPATMRAVLLTRPWRLDCLVFERYSRDLWDKLGLKLLEPHFALSGGTEVLIWAQRNSDDPGPLSLGERLQRLASKRFG